ncbi:unnamed protein product [Cylindrotheca closterium]|uniref:Uncharacterized protein n=1 Tax=Cylindrotheca closterium TaxID=2856 RepID=A0AAD2FBK3_9STRA|nr:unnamed protein product [Cylindrotheca closterium]
MAVLSKPIYSITIRNGAKGSEHFLVDILDELKGAIGSEERDAAARLEAWKLANLTRAQRLEYQTFSEGLQKARGELITAQRNEQAIQDSQLALVHHQEEELERATNTTLEILESYSETIRYCEYQDRGQLPQFHRML